MPFDEQALSHEPGVNIEPGPWNLFAHVLAENVGNHARTDLSHDKAKPTCVEIGSDPELTNGYESASDFDTAAEDQVQPNEDIGRSQKLLANPISRPAWVRLTDDNDVLCTDATLMYGDTGVNSSGNAPPSLPPSPEVFDSCGNPVEMSPNPLKEVSGSSRTCDYGGDEGAIINRVDEFCLITTPEPTQPDLSTCDTSGKCSKSHSEDSDNIAIYDTIGLDTPGSNFPPTGVPAQTGRDIGLSRVVLASVMSREFWQFSSKKGVFCEEAACEHGHAEQDSQRYLADCSTSTLRPPNIKAHLGRCSNSGESPHRDRRSAFGPNEEAFDVAGCSTEQVLKDRVQNSDPPCLLVPNRSGFKPAPIKSVITHLDIKKCGVPPIALADEWNPSSADVSPDLEAAASPGTSAGEDRKMHYAANEIVKKPNAYTNPDSDNLVEVESETSRVREIAATRTPEQTAFSSCPTSLRKHSTQHSKRRTVRFPGEGMDWNGSEEDNGGRINVGLWSGSKRNAMFDCDKPTVPRAGTSVCPPKNMQCVFCVLVIVQAAHALTIPAYCFYCITTLKLPAFQIGALMSAYSCGQLLGAPVAGRLSDALGRRPVFIITVLWTSIWLLLTACAANMRDLMFTRMMVGLFGGSLAVAERMVLDKTPSDVCAAAMTSMNVAYYVACSCGPALWVLVQASFHPVALSGLTVAFVIASSFTFAGFVFTLFAVQETLPPHERKRGQALCPKPCWSANSIIAETLEGCRADAMCIRAARFCITSAMVALVLVFPLHMHQKYGWGQSQFGWFCFDAGAFGATAIVVIYPSVSRHCGKPVTFNIGAMLIAIYFFGCQLLQNYLGSAGVQHLVLVTFVLGCSLCIPTMPDLLTKYTDENGCGIGQSVSTSLLSISSVIMPMFFGILYDIKPNSVYWVAGALAVTSVFAVVAIDRNSVSKYFTGEHVHLLQVQSLRRKVSMRLHHAP